MLQEIHSICMNGHFFPVLQNCQNCSNARIYGPILTTITVGAAVVFMCVFFDLRLSPTFNSFLFFIQVCSKCTHCVDCFSCTNNVLILSPPTGHTGCSSWTYRLYQLSSSAGFLQSRLHLQPMHHSYPDSPGASPPPVHHPPLYPLPAHGGTGSHLS